MEAVWCEKYIQSIGELRSTAVIVVQYATQDVSPLDRPRPRRLFQPDRALLIDTLMRSRVVVVVDIDAQHSAKMPFPEDQDPVEALPSNGANPAFRERIRIWRPNWRPDDRDIS